MSFRDRNIGDRNVLMAFVDAGQRVEKNVGQSKFARISIKTPLLTLFYGISVLQSFASNLQPTKFEWHTSFMTFQSCSFSDCNFYRVAIGEVLNSVVINPYSLISFLLVLCIQR
jgi:hypothetical protein